MGSLCSSLFGSSASTSYQPPAAVTKAVTDILGRAATQSNAPYPQYSPATAAQYQNYNAGLLAPLTPNQAQAGQSIAGLQGGTQPAFQQASSMVQNAAQPLQMQQYNQGNINQYMNPYLNDVVGSAVANINQTNAQQQQQVLGDSIQRGAFGGDRAGIAQAELARQQNLSNNATISNLLGQGYSQAQGEFNNQQQTNLATQLQNRSLQSTNALNLANLGTQGQQAALQQAQAQYGYGSAEQQQQQAGLSTAYQQYQNQQAFPYQQLSYYAGLASGAAPALGGTTTGYSPTLSPANAIGQIGQLGTILGGSSGIGGLFGAASNVASVPSPFGLKTGGRVGYASGGSPTSSSIFDAYTKYQQLVASRAPKAILDRAYQDYQNAFYGAAAPYDDAVVAAVKPTETTPAAATSPTATDTTRDGGGNARDNAGNGPVTAENARYSPEFNSSNGPVGGGGYGPYDSGGGPGNTFNSGKNTTGGLIGGALGSLVGGPIGGLLGAALGSYNYNKDNVNTTPYDPTYKGVVSEAPVESLDAVAASNTAPSKATAGNYVNFSAEEQKAGLPAGYLEAVRNLESQNGALTSSGKSTAAGDFQITKSTAEKLGVDPTNLNEAAIGAARLGKDTIGVLGSYGITNPTGGQVYGGHLLGTPDLSSLYSKPDALFAETLGQGKIANNPSIFGGLNLATATNKDALAAIAAAYDKNAAVAKANEQNYFNKPEQQKLTDDMDASIAADRARMEAAKQTETSGASTPSMDPRGTAERSGLGLGVGPAGSPDNSGLGGVSASTEGHGPNSGLGNVGTGVGATTEGHGPGGLDRSNAEVDHTPAESGSSLGGRGNGPSVSDHTDPNTPDTATLGDARTSDPDAAEKRGGRIHAHHYAAGGYAPINMMYGMPTQSDIGQIASDEAGSGAGVLSPQLAALAAKGVIPNAKGGRIHAADGTGISTNQNNDSGDQSVDQTGLHWWDAGYDPTKHPEVAERLNKNAQQESDVQNMPEWQYQIGNAAKNIVDATSGVANTAKSTWDYLTSPHGKTDSSTVAPKRNPEPSLPVGKPIPGSGKSSTYVPDWAKEGYDPEAAGKAQVSNENVTQSGSGDYMSKVPTLTQPKIPNSNAGWVEDADAATPVVPSKTTSGPVKMAQSAPQTMNDGTKEVAPGIKQWYNAPAPVDRDYLARLAFWQGLGRPGATLSDASSAYQNSILANQAEQRATMSNEAASAHVRAQAGFTGAQEANERLKPYGLGYALVGGNNANNIELTLLPTPDEGQTVSKQGIAQNSMPSQPGANVVATGKNVYNGQTYGLETDKTGNNQDIHNQIVQLGAVAKKNNMPADHAQAFKNQDDMNTIVKNLNEQADAANQQMTANNEITKAIHSYSQLGPKSPGFAGQTKAQVLSAMNASANTLFGVDLGLSQYSSDQDIINKMRIVAANTGSDSRAAKWIEQYANALPGVGLNADAIKTLVSNMYVDRFRKNNLAQFADTYNTASLGQARDIGTAFTRITGNEPQRYTDLQNSIVKLLKTHQPEIDPETGKPKIDPKTGKLTGGWAMNPRTQHYETPISSFLQGDMSAEEFNKEAYAHTGIKNMAAVFGGGR
jgi:hypothetical protein